MGWLKRRSYEFALVMMEVSLATYDAVTKGGPKNTMDGCALVEGVGMFDQNALDMLWFVEKNAGERAKTDTTNISCTRHSPKEAQTIFREIGQVPDQRRSAEKTQRFLAGQACRDLREHSVPRFSIKTIQLRG